MYIAWKKKKKKDNGQFISLKNKNYKSYFYGKSYKIQLDLIYSVILTGKYLQFMLCSLCKPGYFGLSFLLGAQQTQGSPVSRTIPLWLCVLVAAAMEMRAALCELAHWLSLHLLFLLCKLLLCSQCLVFFHWLRISIICIIGSKLRLSPTFLPAFIKR